MYTAAKPRPRGQYDRDMLAAHTVGWVSLIVLSIVVTALYVLRWRSGTRLDRDARTGAQLHVLRGREAKRFAEKQLEQVDVDADARTTTYRNPADGSTWIMDYPRSTLHGGGSPRLRRQGD
jgi:immunity protein 27 of polymorphic toxin system